MEPPRMSCRHCLSETKRTAAVFVWKARIVLFWGPHINTKPETYSPGLILASELSLRHSLQRGSSWDLRSFCLNNELSSSQKESAWNTHHFWNTQGQETYRVLKKRVEFSIVGHQNSFFWKKTERNGQKPVPHRLAWDDASCEDLTSSSHRLAEDICCETILGAGNASWLIECAPNR